MIDIEGKVFNTVYNTIVGVIPSAEVSSVYVETPENFPHVTCVEVDNSVHLATQTMNGGIENHARISYQIDIYSAKSGGAKSECKTIVGLVDSVMLGMGFRRTLSTQTPNIDRKIYRYTLRYEAIVAKGVADSEGNVTYITYN